MQNASAEMDDVDSKWNPCTKALQRIIEPSVQTILLKLGHPLP